MSGPADTVKEVELSEDEKLFIFRQFGNRSMAEVIGYVVWSRRINIPCQELLDTAEAIGNAAQEHVSQVMMEISRQQRLRIMESN